mmetsp:Transcript_2577/g.10203  ORF Transcript_2577/g.10203 Transcript_2577/m.10203 type:complete len:283 (+) Transcript_2577:1249-2097(+)
MLAAESGRSPFSMRSLLSCLSPLPLFPSMPIFFLSSLGMGIFESRAAISLIMRDSRDRMFSETWCFRLSSFSRRSFFSRSTSCTTDSRRSASPSTFAATKRSFFSCSSANRFCFSRPVITSSNKPVSISESSSSSTAFGLLSIQITLNVVVTKNGASAMSALNIAALGLLGFKNVRESGNPEPPFGYQHGVSAPTKYRFTNAARDASDVASSPSDPGLDKRAVRCASSYTHRFEQSYVTSLLWSHMLSDTYTKSTLTHPVVSDTARTTQNCCVNFGLSRYAR